MRLMTEPEHPLSAPFGLSQRTFLIAASALLVVLVFALYWPAAHFDFQVYDDGEYVTNNWYVLHARGTEAIHYTFTAFIVGHWHPVTVLSHMLDAQLYGTNPAGHHLTNVAFHAANVVLLFLLLSSLTGSRGTSLLIAALFAVHPMNIEVVAWVAERKTLLSAFLALLTIMAYRRYALRPAWNRYLLVLLLFALALMAKATAITLPVLLLLFDFWPLGRAPFSPKADRSDIPTTSVSRLITEKIPMFLLCIASAWVTIYGQQSGIASLPLRERLGHAAWSYIAYVLRLVAPSDLAIIHPYVADPLWKMVLGFVLLLGITAFVVVWRRKPYLSTGWLFYVVAMLPVSGIIQVGYQSYAEHYLYFPEIGIFLLFAFGSRELARQSDIRPTVRVFACIAIVLTFAAITAANLKYWKNGYTLFARAERLAQVPDPVIELTLGDALMNMGNNAEALQHYALAVKLVPRDPLAHYNLARTYSLTGDFTNALQEYQTAIALGPSPKLTAASYYQMGLIYLEKDDLDTAEKLFSTVVKWDPGSADAFFGRGRTLFRLSRFEDASRDFDRAASLEQAPMAYYWLGRSFEQSGKTDQAIAALKEAIRLDPNYADARDALARLGQGK